MGLYFAKRPAAREVRSLAIAAPAGALDATAPGQAATFSQVVTESIDAVAVRADINRPNVRLEIEAVRPDGSRRPLIRLRTRPDWQRRYWFEQPVSLPPGTRIEVAATAIKNPDDEAVAEGNAPPTPSDAAAVQSRCLAAPRHSRLRAARQPAGGRAHRANAHAGQACRALKTSAGRAP